MKLNWKNVKHWMNEWNPYKKDNESNNDNYNKLWDAVRTLCVFNFEEGNTIFVKMVKYDRELFEKGV